MTVSTERQPLEPIAIVGMACRFPKAPSVDAYWRMLLDGVDAITQVPALRWPIDELYDSDPAAPGKMNTRFGGFLDDVECFDADFFGIAPREALQVTPQQRILLEVTWHALEDAHIVPDGLLGAPVGAFIGVASFDYYERILADVGQINAYTLTGNAYAIAANRLSYVFDWRGPSVVIDTACSSSLTAIHLACQSLRLGECELAVAGGAHTILAPWVTVAASKGEFMAPDGRCKTFSAAADGYVRGEGVGAVVLKRLADAQRAGDPVAAVIRGSFINQDGRSNGLTAPNPAAQVAVLRAAYRAAGVNPASVGYVETHGTGTRLGDPMEVNALASVLGEGRAPGTSALIGSVKTNIGHLEASAGIAGLIKAALAVKHGLVPPNLHFDEPNPLIDFAHLPVRVPTEVTPWPMAGARIAGVSSFGVGGTNAHVVLQEPPRVTGAARADTTTDATEPPACLLCFSAKDEAALAPLAGAYRAQIDAILDENAGGEWPAGALAELCSSAGLGRSHFPHRAAIVIAGDGAWRRSLDAMAARTTPVGARRAARSGPAAKGRRRRRNGPSIAFVYTGQGAQRPEMGAGLYRAHAGFRDAFDRAVEGVCPGDIPLRAAMFDAAHADALKQTAYAQPATFAFQIAATEMLARAGVRPAVVLGHSVGELAAMVAAGACSLDDARGLAATRGALMQRCPPGAMAAIAADEQTVVQRLASHDGRIEIAAVNSDREVVVAGPADAVAALVKELTRDRIPAQPLVVSHAFHSHMIEGALAELATVARATRLRTPEVMAISGVTGAPFSHEGPPDAYWVPHARQTVRFLDAAQALLAREPDAIIEIGPKPVLIRLLGRITRERGLEIPLIPLITGGGAEDEWPAALAALGACYARGATLDFAGIDGGRTRRRRPLPAYPFARDRYWLFDGAPSYTAVAPFGGQDRRFRHAMLQDAEVKALPDGAQVVSMSLGHARLPYLADHSVFGTETAPATLFLTALQVAAGEVLRWPHVEPRDIEYGQPLVLGGRDRRVDLVLTPMGTGGARLRFEFVDGDARAAGAERTRYATGLIDRIEVAA